MIRLCAREMRGAWRHFGYALACVALGVGALVAVGSFADSLERTVGRSAKSLTGADVEIRSTRPLSAEADAVLAALAREGVARMRVLELAAMARTGQASALIELKAVPPGYPFYGRLTTDPDRSLGSLIGDGRALVHDALLARLGLTVGEPLHIGGAAFTITGRITGEPDRSAGVFSLGPRVLIAADDLGATGLVQPGSRVRHRTLLRLPAGEEPEVLRERLTSLLPDPALRITTFRQAQPGLRRFWEQLTLYLGLTGLVALLVGGIGVGSSVTAFIRERLQTIAILKCLGAGWRQVLGVYLAQAVVLGLAGGTLGAALGTGLQPLLAPFLSALLPFEVESVVSSGAVLRGIAMGLGVTLLCSLWPLLEIRQVPPALILRRDVEATLPGRRPWAAALPIAAGLAALALWQAGSWKVGGLFVGGVAAGLGLLLLGARGTIALSRRLPRRGPLVWRQGTAALHRPGGHTGAVLVTLGLAVMLIVSVALLETSLRNEISGRSPTRAPAFFFVDVQPDQAERFARIVAETSGEAPPELIPVVRSRLAAIKGVPVVPDAGRRDEQWYLTREYVLTWAAAPPGRDTVVAGRWWTAAEAAREPLISVEEEIARTRGVALGDMRAFDIQGVTLSARVVSLRKVDWRSLGANFFVIFSQGALAGAPATYLATARAHPDREAAVQAAVVAAFPNVTAIPVREVLERVAAIVDQIALAIRLVAGFTVVAGLVVLAGALAVTRRQRLYESVILKAVGATRSVLARAFAVEYALLGVAAGLAGTALAAVLAWTVEQFFLELPWSWQPTTLALGVAGPAALALAVGFLGTFRLLGHPPLGVLRRE
ncbi:MAG: FtsX-like permease family protein [Candidatus Rokubacteria bacterium]|nr:FtsX-like permease family protein [Candidatus Rokubacteria bacterium]